MSSFPFYSSQLREALVEIISNHEEHDGSSASATLASDPIAAASAVPSHSNPSPGSAVIRGKWSGGYDASSSSDEDDDNADSDNDDSDSSSANSSPGTMEAIRENNEDPIASSPPATARRKVNNGNGGRTKKSNGKKSKDVKVQKMGKAPSVVLPFHVTNSNNSAKTDTSSNRALEVPNVLLPHNYLRDNPNYKVSSAAKSLLSRWDRFFASSDNSTILVILLQSGRFAACVFSVQSNNTSGRPKMLAHKTSTRYTVRKGQGGSQSSNDGAKGKAKSIGAQLRREGEKQLRDDARSAWREWKEAGYVARAVGVYVSAPKNMRRDYLFGGDADGGSGTANADALVGKGDERLRNIPLDVGRPTMEAAVAVSECLLNCNLRDMTEEERKTLEGLSVPDDVEDFNTTSAAKEVSRDNQKIDEVEDNVEPTTPEIIPLTPLHEAVLDGDLSNLLQLLKLLDESEERDTTTSSIDYDINTPGGPNNETPLHTASSSNHPNAASLLNALLLQGHADPCAVDARGRPPYFLAASDKHREAFRLARGTLGEGHCQWDEGAKVGPALSEEDVRSKKAKAAEKKRKQRARQKQKKAAEKVAAEEEAARQREEEEERKREEDAKRVRDGLKPKKSTATNACDFCQKVVKGKRRSQMFQRLEYAYCSTECVRRHQRELMAAAATARLGG